MLSCQIIPLNQYLTQIIDPTGVSCFLLQGSQESVLIDTGTGMRQLLQALEDLSVSSPLVLLSHGHADHAGGAACAKTLQP
jgi:glyoxylase-like metal-dependent hydrolase (beta-lactamase superfamily II)